MLEKIKYLCGKKDITFAALEKNLGFANGSIAKTDEKIQSVRLKAIADYFGVTMDYFFEDDFNCYVNNKTIRAAQELFENRELRVLFDTARNLNDDDLKTLQTMASALAKKENTMRQDILCKKEEYDQTIDKMTADGWTLISEVKDFIPDTVKLHFEKQTPTSPAPEHKAE